MYGIIINVALAESFRRAIMINKNSNKVVDTMITECYTVRVAENNRNTMNLEN